jgi:hypothetical protein
VAFFAAVISAEVAVVAWLRGVARVLATRTSPALSVADRHLVRRCGAVSLSALTVAVGGWSTALVVSIWARYGGLDAGAFAALATMTTSVALGWLAWRRMRFNLHDDEPGRRAITSASSASSESNGWSWAESVVLAAIRRLPFVVCAVAAIGSALWVLLNAETSTVADAWPWAAAQAGAVVVGFVGLGPPLGLGGGGDNAGVGRH